MLELELVLASASEWVSELGSELELVLPSALVRSQLYHKSGT